MEEGFLSEDNENTESYRELSLDTLNKFLDELPNYVPPKENVIFTSFRESERLGAYFDGDEVKLHQMHMEDLRNYRNNRKKLYKSILKSHGKEIMLECIYLNVNFRKKHRENKWTTERIDIYDDEYSWLYYTKEVHLTEEGLKKVTVRHQDGYYYSDDTTEVYKEEYEDGRFI